MQIFESEEPITATLRHWIPKCSTELERRIRLDFEIPLTGDLINALPDALRRTANAIGNLEDGLTEGTISTAYSQTLEIYDLPEQRDPRIVIPNALLVGMHIYRPTPKEGPSDDLFLVFRTTVRAEGDFGDQLVTWALRNLRGTVFFKAFEAQRELPLEPAATAA